MLTTRQGLDSQLPSGEVRAAITEISGPVEDLGLLAGGSAGREIATGRLALVQNHSPRPTGTR